MRKQEAGNSGPKPRRTAHSGSLLVCAAGLAVLLGISSCDFWTGPAVGRPAAFGALERLVGGPVGMWLHEPLAVLVTDSAGRPVPGALINWSAVDGEIRLEGETSKTDRDGIATMRVQLASSPGIDFVRFWIQGWSAGSMAIYTFPAPFDVEVLGPGEGADFAPDGGVAFMRATENGLRPFRWEDGHTIEVGGLPSWEVHLAAAAVDGGVVVSWTEGKEERSFLIRSGQRIEIGKFGDGVDVRALDINAYDNIVGTERAAGFNRVFVWSAGSSSYFDSVSAFPIAINGHNQVLAHSGSCAVVFDGEAIDSVPSLFYDCAIATDINSSGAVIAHTVETYPCAFVWVPGFSLAGCLPRGFGRYSKASAINDAGNTLIKAEMTLGHNNVEPLWVTAGTGFPLDLLVTADGWNITGANDIDDDDRILAIGTHPDYENDQVLLLTPVR